MPKQEPTITIPAKKYKEMHEAAEAMANRFQETNGRQVEIINRLMAEKQQDQGYKLLGSVLLDRMLMEWQDKNATDQGLGDPAEFRLVIGEDEMVETNPGAWVGGMEKDPMGKDCFVVRLVEFVDVPMKEDGTPDIDKMNDEALKDLDDAETGDSNARE
jgi:hypothetical protein